jgi:hypothetical protein
MNKLQ